MNITIDLVALIHHIWSLPVAVVMAVLAIPAAICFSDRPHPSHPRIWRTSQIYLIFWVTWVVIGVLRGINVL